MGLSEHCTYYDGKNFNRAYDILQLKPIFQVIYQKAYRISWSETLKNLKLC